MTDRERLMLTQIANCLRRSPAWHNLPGSSKALLSKYLPEDEQEYEAPPAVSSWACAGG